MIRFEYDNIEADKLILEFKCKECHSLTKTELLSVPEFVFDTFKNISYSYKHRCQCGASYTIEITNGLYDSFGLINGIIGNEEDVFVHELPVFPYDKNTILLDTIQAYSRIESIVDGIKSLSKEDQNYIYCLLFSNLISIIDSFVKIYTEPIVLGNDDLIEKFAVSFGMHKGDREEKKEKIKDFYKRKSFQSVSNQKKLLMNVFNVNMEIDNRVDKYVTIRDVIIHRNAIDTEGYIHKITKTQLLQALEVIKIHIRNLFSALSDVETNIYIGKILNNQ